MKFFLGWVLLWSMQATGEVRRDTVKKSVEQIRWVVENLDSHRVEIRNFPPRTTEDFGPSFGDVSAVLARLNGEFTLPSWGAEAAFVWDQSLGRLSEAENQAFFDAVVDYSKTETNLAQMMYINPFDAIWPESKSLKELMEAIPAVPQGVRWDGAAEMFQYEDRQLRENVIRLAAFIHRNHLNLASHIDSVPAEVLQKFQFNTQEDTPTSKTEPFDLVQGEITRYNYLKRMLTSQNGISGLNRIVLTKSVHRYLHKLLRVPAEADAWGAGLPDLTILPYSGQGIFFMCAGELEYSYKIGEVTSRTQGFGFPAVTYFQSASEVDFSGSTAFCDGQAYAVRSEFRQGEELSIPSYFPIRENTADRPAKALITFALQSESTPQFLIGVKRYMELVGYELEGEQDDIETLAYTQEKLLDFDMLIPVAHALSMSNFHLGTKTSKLMIFSRFLGEGEERRKVEIHALFPQLIDNVSSYETIDRDHMKDIFVARIARKVPSLFILNASCWSTNTLFPWTLAYREAGRSAVELGYVESFAALDSVPHVFGSDRSFPTGSFSELIGNFSHPLNTIESLVNGVQPEEIFQQLGQPAPQRFVEAGEILMRESGSEESIRNEPYDPSWNIREPLLMNSDGVDLGMEPIVYEPLGNHETTLDAGSALITESRESSL